MPRLERCSRNGETVYDSCNIVEEELGDHMLEDTVRISVVEIFDEVFYELVRNYSKGHISTSAFLSIVKKLNAS